MNVKEHLIMPSPSKRYRFTHGNRLHGSRAFGGVYAARARKVVGPLVIHSKPNELGHPRLGLSVSKKVGKAVKRNRIKRLLREAFRLSRGRFPQNLDVLVVVRGPEPPDRLDDVREALVRLIDRSVGATPRPRKDTRRGRRRGR